MILLYEYAIKIYSYHHTTAVRALNVSSSVDLKLDCVYVILSAVISMMTRIGSGLKLKADSLCPKLFWAE